VRLSPPVSRRPTHTAGQVRLVWAQPRALRTVLLLAGRLPSLQSRRQA
jgi:hypothetical protein